MHTCIYWVRCLGMTKKDTYIHTIYIYTYYIHVCRLYTRIHTIYYIGLNI